MNADASLHIVAADVLKLLLAVALGGIIGLEREVRDKPAGFRTMILIAVGSTLFTMFSIRMGAGVGRDPGRIAAQVVTGVGFLGAGAILRDHGRIAGLTTAAAIWLVASLGIGLGIGDFGPTLVGTGFVLVVLLVLSKVEAWVDVRRDRRKYTIRLAPDPRAEERVRALAAKHALRPMIVHLGKDEKAYQVEVTLVGGRDRHSAFGQTLLADPTVLSVTSE